MYCVTAKVAQKIAMLLENNGINAGTREQQPRHHARGSAASDTAARVDTSHSRWNSVGRRVRALYGKANLMQASQTAPATMAPASARNSLRVC